MPTGRVVAVDQQAAGVTVDGDHFEDDSVISVMDCVDLDESGGFLTLPSGEVVEYGPTDLQGTSVTLIEELPEDVEDAERLATFPPLVSTTASVVIDEDGHAEPVPVEVPSGIAGWSSLAPGASLRFEVTRGGDLVATDVTAGSLEVAADQVSNGTIRSEWRMSRDGAIVVGDDDAGSGAFTHDGLRFSVPGPVGPYENVVMTTGETSFGVMGEDGTRLGGVDAEGNVSGPSGSFEELSVGGETLDEILGRLPRGVLARQFKSTAEQSIATGVERAYMRLNATLHPGRLYRVKSWMRVNLASAPGAACSTWIRYELGGTTSLSSDTLPDTLNFSASNASTNHRITVMGEGFLEVENTTSAQFLLTYRGEYGATPSVSYAHFYVEDVGGNAPITGGGSEGDPDDEDIPDVQSFTTTWIASASRGYTQTGAAIPEKENLLDLWYWHGDPAEFHNAAMLFGGGAAFSSHGSEFGLTLPQALNGATISSVRIHLSNKVWLSSPTRYSISTLASSTLPSTRVIARQQSSTANWPSGSGQWIVIPNDWFTNGANRGICLGDYRGHVGSGDHLTSGSLHGPNDTHPPLLEITYSR